LPDFWSFGSLRRIFGRKNEKELGHKTWAVGSPEHLLFFSENRIKENQKTAMSALIESIR